MDQHGAVVLTGIAISPEVKRVLFQVARELEGVESVKDEIVVGESSVEFGDPLEEDES